MRGSRRPGRIERSGVLRPARSPQKYGLAPDYPQICEQCARFDPGYASSGHDSFEKISRKKASGEKVNGEKVNGENVNGQESQATAS